MVYCKHLLAERIKANANWSFPRRTRTRGWDVKRRALNERETGRAEEMD